MKKIMFLCSLVVLLSIPAGTYGATTTTEGIKVGLDFAMPYTLRANGASAKARGNFNIGVDGRYYWTDHLNIGTRLFFDVEARGNSVRQIGLAPGVQYRWFPEKTLNPFVRFDLPIILRGAANTSGSNFKQDVGIAGGIGMAWNLGETIGVENFAIRYDFAVNYLFGIGAAVNVLALDLFKIGFDYRF